MRMYHVTAAANIPSIADTGINHHQCCGKTVWICTEHKVGIIISKVMKRKRLFLHEIGVVEINVPKSWVRRGHRGLRHTGGRSVPPERITRTFTVATVATGLDAAVPGG